MRIAIALIISILSMFFIIKLESNSTLKVNNKTEISSLESFSYFWKLELTKKIPDINIIGYKEEEFNKSLKIYSFNYKFKELSGLDISFNIIGKIYFDNNYNIDSFSIIIGKKYILEGKNIKNKIQIFLSKIGDKNKIFSKIIDKDKLNFDFFIFYTINKQDLKIGKKYKYKIISFKGLLNNKNILQEIIIERASENEYLVNIENIIFKLKFNKGKLVYKENLIYKEKLIENIKEIKRIKNQINGKKNKTNKEKSLNERLNLEKEIEKIKSKNQVKYCPILNNK